jgi:hypothetical protein
VTRSVAGAVEEPGRWWRRGGTLRHPLAALPLLLLLLGPAVEGQTVPQCREANTQAIAAFKASLDHMPVRDRERAATLVAELERLIRDNRAAGIDECATWTEIHRRVSRQ